jgi:hypothetical protein
MVGALIWDHDIGTETSFLMKRAHRERWRSSVLPGGGVGGAASSSPSISRPEEAWRFKPGAPGEPGGNSWNDLPLDKRSGGSVGIRARTSRTEPRFRHRADHDTQAASHPPRQARRDERYALRSSTIALNPTHGRLVCNTSCRRTTNWITTGPSNGVEAESLDERRTRTSSSPAGSRFSKRWTRGGERTCSSISA